MNIASKKNMTKSQEYRVLTPTGIELTIALTYSMFIFPKNCQGVDLNISIFFCELLFFTTAYLGRKMYPLVKLFSDRARV